MLSGETVIVVVIAALCGLLAARFMRDNGWDMLAAILASGTASTVLAFRHFEIVPGADVANGIGLYARIVLSAFYLLIVAIVAPATVCLARSRWPGSPGN